MPRKTNQNPLFAQSPVGAMVLNREGEVLDVNPAGCEDFARKHERLVETPLSDWILPGDRRKTEEALERVLDGSAATWKARIRRGDGLPRLQEFRANPLRRDDRVEAILVFLRDLAEGVNGRPDASQLLTLVENLPGQFLLVTDKQGKIRYSSGLGRTHFRDNGSVLGLHYRELLGQEWEEDATVRDLFQKVGAGRSWAGVQWHRRKDGASFPAEVFASPQHDPRSGQVLGVMLVGRDLSEVRKWRDKAERTRPLAQIGSLATRVAREMARGLSRLEEKVSSGLPRGDVSPGLEEELRSELRTLRRFVAGVAEFGDRGNLRRGALSLAELVAEALDRMAGRVGSCGVNPMVEIPPNLPTVFADRRYLTRILDIFLDNALDALEGVSEPVLKLELRDGSDGVLLRVTNSGASVGKEWLEEIFDPFFTSKEGRPGLGLTVARGMIQAQEGRLWAEVPQEGLLTLSMELPREAPDRVKSFRPVPLNLSRPRTVLVVDDDESVRVALRAFLEKVGYQVREAWSGRSALAQLTSARLPEIVLTDLKMSDGSGYWFLEELERDFPRLVPRTVIVTGDADHQAADDLSQRTGCPLVRKPFELPQLLEILDQVGMRS